MDATIENHAGVSLVRLAGRLSGSEAEALQNQLLPLASAPNCRVLLDLSATAYISSGGLRALLVLQREAEKQHGLVALAGLPEILQDLLDITGFARYFTIYPDVDTGLLALQAH